jgi:Zn-dependent M32 family carboxypeptidase
MVTATAKPAKPAKLTEALINEYFDESEKLKEAKETLKPLADKVNSLYDQIESSFLACGKDKKKVGKWLLNRLTKKGSVPWKNELVKRLTSDELKAIEAAAPEKTEVEIKAA